MDYKYSNIYARFIIPCMFFFFSSIYVSIKLAEGKIVWLFSTSTVAFIHLV